MTPAEVDQAFMEQISNDYCRVAYCAPGHEAQVGQVLAAQGFGGVIEVRASPFMVDPECVVVVDEKAAEASMAQFRQRINGGGSL